MENSLLGVRPILTMSASVDARKAQSQTAAVVNDTLAAKSSARFASTSGDFRPTFSGVHGKNATVVTSAHRNPRDKTI